MTERAVDERIVAGALLGTFLGDALGAPFEGARPTDRWDDGWSRLEASLAREVLTHTDDTQLMMALAEHLVEDDPEVDPERLRDRFLDHYEPGRGYGGGMRMIVAAWRRGEPLAQAARTAFDDGSAGNGAAMRVAPVGARWPLDDDVRIAAARRSAQPTHVHRDGIAGAVVMADAVALAARSGGFDRSSIVELASHRQSVRWHRLLGQAATLADPQGQPHETVHELSAGVLAVESVPTALWVAATNDTIPEAAATALALGGDADTIAAMALAVLGAAQGRDGFDPDWISRLENGPRGRDYCLELARRLAGAEGAHP